MLQQEVSEAVEAIRLAKREGRLPVNVQMDQGLIKSLGSALRNAGISGVFLSRDPDANKGVWAYAPEGVGYRG